MTRRAAENLAVVRGALLLVLLCALLGCGTTHTMPETSTETGNPVLRGELLALVVSSGEVHITGKPGAVSPGGSEVLVEDVSTAASFDTVSEADGSFDVEVDGAAEDAYVVLALRGKRSSEPVYVLRGQAVIVGGKQKLSCEQQSSIASVQILQAASAADRSCATDHDCTEKQLATTCSDSCYDGVAVSHVGAADIQDAADAIAESVCTSFDADGCEVLALPCEPPLRGALRCNAGACEFASEVGIDADAGATALDAGSASAGGSDCNAAFDPGGMGTGTKVYWHDPMSNACVPRSFGGGTGNGNRFESLAACRALCAATTDPGDCPPSRIFTTQCLECGPTDACLETDTLCALPCSDSSECADEATPASICVDNTCRNICG